MGLFSNEIIVTPQIKGVTNGSVAQAGYLGEFKQALVPVGSAVSLTTVTPANVASLVLTPGDWDVTGNINITATGATTAAGALQVGGIGTTTAAIPTNGTEVQEYSTALTTTNFKNSITIPPQQFSVTTNTTVYMVMECTFTAGTIGAYGALSARRLR